MMMMALQKNTRELLMENGAKQSPQTLLTISADLRRVNTKLAFQLEALFATL
jgi:hypothetical protein